MNITTIQKDRNSISSKGKRVGCKDIWLAAYVKANDIPLIDIERQGNHSIFFFEESDKLTQLIEEYVKDRAVINIKVIKAALYSLKSLAVGDIPLTEKGDLR